MQILAVDKSSETRSLRLQVHNLELVSLQGTLLCLPIHRLLCQTVSLPGRLTTHGCPQDHQSHKVHGAVHFDATNPGRLSELFYGQAPASCPLPGGQRPN